MKSPVNRLVTVVSLLLACLMSSCSSDEITGVEVGAMDVPATNPEAPAMETPRVAVRPEGLALFSGQALTVVRERGLPGGVALQGKVDEVARSAAAAEECQSSTRPADTFLVDMNADGRHEGISIYTLSSCRVGGEVRILTVLQQDARGQWSPMLESALTIGNEPARDIIGIDPARGTITVQGAFDVETDSRMEPEVITVARVVAVN